MISNLILASTIFLFTSDPPLKNEVDVADYSYINMNGGPVIGFYKNNPKVQIQDVIVDANDCSTKTLVCIEAEGLFIAIPNRAVGYAADGTKVEVVKEMDAIFFGVHAHVHVIDAIRHSARYKSWYSDDLGLLAFSVTADGKTATYLLEQTVGLKAGWKGSANRPSNAEKGDGGK